MVLFPLVFDSAVPLDAAEQNVVVEACSETLAPDRCQATVAASDAVYGVVRIQGAELGQATLVVVNGEQTRTHEIEFRRNDLREERLRALGIVVASLLASVRSEPVGPAWVPPPPPPVTPAEQQQFAPTGVWRARATALLTEAGELMLGPQLGFSYLPSSLSLARVQVGPTLSLAAQRTLDSSLDVLDVGSLGLGLMTVVALGEVVHLPVEVQAVGQAFQAEASSDSGEQDSATTQRIGASLSAGLSWAQLAPLTVEVGAGARLFRNGPKVRVGGRQLHEFGAFSASGYVGIGLIF